VPHHSILEHEGLQHLPLRKRRELLRAVQTLFETFDDAVRHKGPPTQKAGRILKIVLFGSHARGGWIEDRKTRYFSDFDVLVVVDNQAFTEVADYWHAAADRFAREEAIADRYGTPVQFIVHDLDDVNDQIAKGRPFFIDIARDGIVLFETVEGAPFANHRAALPDHVILAEAMGHFERWFANARRHFKVMGLCIAADENNLAAFHLHQVAECLYHCVLLVSTLYSPKMHDLRKLRRRTAQIDPRLQAIWPDNNRWARQAFDRLYRAYVEARYSPHYAITAEQLEWLTAQAKLMLETVEAICRERLIDGKLGIASAEHRRSISDRSVPNESIERRQGTIIPIRTLQGRDQGGDADRTRRGNGNTPPQ
jgi:uncharacterized protein